jgi:hypothetical protein
MPTLADLITALNATRLSIRGCNFLCGMASNNPSLIPYLSHPEIVTMVAEGEKLTKVVNRATEMRDADAGE